MNLQNYVKGYDNDNSKYILNSVIEHQGEINFGHYICYCKKNDGFYNVRYQIKPFMIWIWISIILISFGGILSIVKKNG